MAKKKEDVVPENNKTRKPIAKKSFKLEDYLNNKNIDEIVEKPMKWIKLSPAFQKAIGMPGFPMGYASMVRGLSNTGKSTAAAEAAVVAQKMGALPIIIITEGTYNRDRLEIMGFDRSLPYIMIDNDYLLKKYGKVQDAKRKQAAIEDLGECVKDFIEDQETGKLPFDLVFIIDSIGTLDCIRSINAIENNTTNNNMWNAGAYEKAFKYMLNYTIPSSRKTSSQYTNTFISVQKVWVDSMQGAGVMKNKGGEALFFSHRLIIQFGGVNSHGTTAVKATSKKREMSFGTETKVKVEKNQVDGDLGGIAFESSKIISVPHGFIFREDIEEYKKKHILYFRNLLGDDTLNPEDIGEKYEADPNAEIDYSKFVQSVDEENLEK